MKVTFLAPAEQELDDAFQHYEAEQDGLGHRFLTEVEYSINRVKWQPLSYQRIGKYSRRSLIHKFPYGVIYQYLQDPEEIRVVCVAHLHRKPNYWTDRMALFPQGD